MKTALLIVDLQRDFLPGGALAVPEGDKVIPIAAKLLKLPFDEVVATQDWHPADHGSFAATHALPAGSVVELAGVEQILWPTHCVQNSAGAEFAGGWDQSRITHIVHKGTSRLIDSYSSFFDNAKRQQTDLEAFLRRRKVTRLFVMGLATNYCVMFSALDAIELGFETYVVTDGCRGIDLKAGDTENALREMKAAGVHLCHSDEVATLLRQPSETISG